MEVEIMLKYVETKEAPAAIGPYSQGVVVNGFAFFSGQVPLSPQTGEVVGTTIEEQAEQVMKNIKGLLDSQNAAFTDVVKTTCFLADIADFAAFNAVYAKYFTGNPARSCVAVKDLPKGSNGRLQNILKHSRATCWTGRPPCRR